MLRFFLVLSIAFVQIISLIPLISARFVPVSYTLINGSTCSYQACHQVKTGYINIHLIPHSHDDVGWLKTVEQYYYGLRNDIYEAGVQYIYDSTVASLNKSKDRRFIWVETAFFWKWWQEQNDEMRDDVKRLVQNGQLEFVGGGWSMNDEAVTTYQSIIDQMTWGFRRINDTFGTCAAPRVGWQIDPFGHSSEMASIFAGLGFDGVLLGRIDYQDQKQRLSQKTMEMVWRGSESLGSASDIFTGILFDHYDAPKGFNFGGIDFWGNSEPIVDDPNSPEFNVVNKVRDLLNYVNKAHTHFATSNFLIPMGSDFAYQNAEKWYSSMDKLIKYINGRAFDGQQYNLIYSTPSCYLKAVHDESNGKLPAPLKTDDFFPYASEAHSYWTGYFTSRPTLKKYERVGNSFLQSCKQLAALTNLSSEDHLEKLTRLREAMGVMQHHDAVTGTEKEVVAYDYARLLHQGIQECRNLTTEALMKLTFQETKFTQCLLTNISECDISERKSVFVVTVQNLLSRPISKYVRLPVLGTEYSIKDSLGEEVPWQLLAVPEPLKEYPGRKSKAPYELVFDARDIQPLGFKSYFVERLKQGKIEIKPEVVDQDSETIEIRNENQNMTLHLNTKIGLLEKLTMNGIELELIQNFFFYNGSNGADSSVEFHRPSGAYIFRPDMQYPFVELEDKNINFTIYKGKLVTEIHQKFSSWISQVITVYKDRNYVEFNWLVGPLPADGPNGKEVITRFTTKLKSNSTLYTDSNARGLLKRIRNYRPTWNLATNESISSNYYPVTAEIAIRDEDENIGMTLVTDRAQGGTSLRDGEIELMLHRYTVMDDNLGVDEALAEIAFNQGLVARGQIYLMFGSTDKNTDDGKILLENERKLKELSLMNAQIFLSVPKERSYEQYNNHSYNMEFEGIKNSLPRNVHIMTLEPWQGSSYLLRLEHLFEKNEHPEYSKPAVVDLEDLFTTFSIISIRETTLGANQWLEESDRLKFESNDKFKQYEEQHFNDYKQSRGTNNFKVLLNPQQIRTFIVDVESTYF